MASNTTNSTANAEDREFSSFNEDDWKRTADEDEATIFKILNQSQEQGGGDQLSGGILDVKFSQEGKADDAEDFEDISDDDLPDEEEATGGGSGSGDGNGGSGGLGGLGDITGGGSGEAPGLTDDSGGSHDTDDLFGDQPSSPIHGVDFGASPGADDGGGDGGAAGGSSGDAQKLGLGASGTATDNMADSPFPAEDADETRAERGDDDDDDDDEAEDPFAVTDSDRALNFPEDYGHAANQDPNIPAAAETTVDLVKLAFPTFEKGIILNFNEQLAPKPLTLAEKKPNRLPKPLIPSKLSVEFEPDQEKLFRIPGTAQATLQQKIKNAAARGYVSLLVPEVQDDDNGNIFFDAVGDDGDDDEDEPVGGFRLKDLSIVCADWDEIAGLPPTPPADEETKPVPTQTTAKRTHDDDEIDLEDDEWEREILGGAPLPKRRKIVAEKGLPRITRYVAPSFDAFEAATARAAKRVYLDMADRRLLLDEADNSMPSAKRARLAGGGEGGGGGATEGTLNKAQQDATGAGQQQKSGTDNPLTRSLTSRFNFSNDQAYEQLKENHQNRVRAQLSNVQVEHSKPALKLLWPYYAITRYGPEPHDYHRPQLKYNKGIGFPVRMSRLHKLAKREWKFKKVQEIFARSRDLSLGDNATAVLFEYCEEIPTVLSNFGMGNKVINYYRRKSKGDDEKPAKPELGEVSFLLPEDKSPFSNFGSVDPGETVPTIHNPMFHAPIFKHQVRGTDFLFGRTHTSSEGTTYYLRKIDHLYVVGQTFPLAEVPGPHSRKVTALSKNRLKMVAYRLIHKNGSVSLPDITSHVKDSNDAQNRQKLKEFLHYDKETKTWGLKPDDQAAMVDLNTINSMIKPDEVCLHDAMQVGQNELAQNGYQLDDSAALDDVDDENDKENAAMSMVPWKTTKSFIDACAGKAMLQLHGAGDPTGRGLGFSFIRTSMKGGFMGAIQGPAATSADAMERERKANNGHMYNVKKQDALYNDAIRKIWASQKSTLEDHTAHDDEDVQPQEDEDDRFNASGKDLAATTMATPHDDRVSQMSRPTNMSAAPEKRKLRITRTYKDEKTGQSYTKTEIVHDAGVISQYMRQRASIDMEKIDPYSVKPTGNIDYDRVLMQRLESEEARLFRNKERRHAREKQKALQQQIHDGDPDSPAPSIERGGTTRKCANCGLQGHIKTNKKLCPMLNGTWKADKGADEGAFGVYAPDGGA